MKGQIEDIISLYFTMEPKVADDVLKEVEKWEAEKKEIIGNIH